MARRAQGQLSLPLPRTWGGRRPGSGPKRAAGRHEASHLARPSHNPRHPVHVTLRVVQGLPSLRAEPAFSALRTAIGRAQRANFRVTHFSAQTNHVHMIVEASSRECLIGGLQGLSGRTAKALNRSWRRRGDVWGGRYHGRALPPPREIRNALIYVLLNFRKHLRAAPIVDPRGSGPWFDGWQQPPKPAAGPSPVALPQTWLGAIGWRRAGGPIDPRERPA